MTNSTVWIKVMQRQESTSTLIFLEKNIWNDIEGHSW